MSRSFRPLPIVAAVAAALFSPASFAGGLYITEFGQPSMGTSGAGWSVLAQDASTGVSNPGGIFQLENDSEWMVAGMYVAPSSKFRSETGTTIPPGKPLFPGANSENA